MNLLSINQARSVWLFPLNDLNPRGKIIERDVVSEMATRYKFAKAPDVKEIVEAREKNKGLIFADGLFKSTSGEIINVTLTIYRDGLIADTRSSTIDSDNVLNEVLTWLQTDFGLLDYKSILVNKIYLSDVFVSMARSLDIINPKFKRFAEMLTAKVKSPSAPLKFEVGALGFWIDPAQKVPQVNFRLERAEGVPFSENRYYSIAPLETEEHLNTLSELENLLTT